jgi:hypothetical protein
LLHFDQLDDQAWAMESGKYFEHLGILEFTLDFSDGLIHDFSQTWINTTVEVR